MTEQERIHCELTAHMFKAMAHPLRVFLLTRLATRPWCVCELAAEAEVEKSVASKHLSLLKEAGLVDAMRIGTQIRYSLTVPCILDLASCAERCVLTNRKKSLGIDPGRDEPHDADDGSGVPVTGRPL
ncbi:ArsR family transcriptional regulator [Candidatus Cryosericum hinesii]|jgi:ArsR family transcriptional regulator|uniref:ArsR family transcriptional regulator n=2 Tax=Candidatus Cryosericum TaxID=2498709 RepID=A0A398DNE4_9BACT|nr:metalloregulator ArsR/SmtB family transcription factor [Candidatus Cryosericum hinesii]RIE10785.1 ArsR family transcriptional regulator [Candidatus Cryosericum hinesii]RIE12311.1 ArsR family transcriptional regulator [Candidatus Cryosericum hinesii]RIE14091.1 ArsR family transcriptional regulator [Candidatus Cryosericum hinesii]